MVSALWLGALIIRFLQPTLSYGDLRVGACPCHRLNLDATLVSRSMLVTFLPVLPPAGSGNTALPCGSAMSASEAGNIINRVRRTPQESLLFFRMLLLAPQYHWHQLVS